MKLVSKLAKENPNALGQRLIPGPIYYDGTDQDFTRQVNAAHEIREKYMRFVNTTHKETNQWPANEAEALTKTYKILDEEIALGITQEHKPTKRIQKKVRQGKEPKDSLEPTYHSSILKEL